MNSTVYAVDEYGKESKDIRSGYVGEFKKFGFAGVPKHCLACDGSEISRATYNELFKVFGETYGAGDGETTFNLPDFRGAFLRCIGGNAAELGVRQGDAIRNITGKIFCRAAYNKDQGDKVMWNESVENSALIPEELVSTSASAIMSTVFYQEYSVEQPLSFSAQNSVPTAIENRPINYAVNVCVVYE